MDCLPWALLQCEEKHCQYAEQIISFMHLNPDRSLSHKKLHYILALYEKWWIYVGKSRSEPFERYVLHYITERAFWSDMKDSEFVSKLLIYLYMVDNHFAFFLYPDKQRSSFLNSEMLSFQTFPGFDHASNHFTHFFLNHAYRQRLTISGKRIADLEVFCRSLWLHPCEMAIITESPALLHVLLQYGGLVRDEPVSIRRLRDYPATGNILIMILCVAKTIVEMLKGDFCSADAHSLDQGNTTKYNNMVMCGRLIIRVTPQLNKRKIDQLDIQFLGFSSVCQALDWVTQHALPELRYRVNVPMPLMHACRLKIRRMLDDNWQLPFGINELLIPNTLKGYLNLYYD